MNILLIGSSEEAGEWKEKFGTRPNLSVVPNWKEALPITASSDVIFDFTGFELTSSCNEILNGKCVFLNTIFSPLHHKLAGLLALESIDISFFGFCGVPSFLNRECLEVSLYASRDRSVLEKICQHLNTDFVIVKDEIGLVTPRVICMIINEAYYTVEEGTATRSDIDLAMKLGTNYPYGPFEWCAKIGLRNVYKLLDSLYQATNDIRYRASSLLVREYHTLEA